MDRQIPMKNIARVSMLCTSAVAAVSVASAEERPNIIYIFTDQQTATAMSCAGNPDLHTPNMDRLASVGVRFTNAYCSAPLSGPSRTAMFTGLYADAVGMSANGVPMPDSLKTRTLGTIVKEVGYECVYGGKWHLPELAVPDGEYGFTQLYGHSDTGLGEACAEYLSHEHDHPFFLVASFDNPHNICEYARNQNLPYGNIAKPDLSDCPELPANFEKNPYDADILDVEKAGNFDVYPTTKYTDEDWRMYRYAYYRLVEKVDAEIGKIIDAIDSAGLCENTVVIFSSDHGDGTGAHRWNQKSALYEEIVNIPLIVTIPGKKNAGEVLPQLISNGVDFFASVCDWTGAEMPEGACGKSFRKLVEEGNAQTAHQSYVITETRFDGSRTRGWMVRGERYKYVLYDRGRYREQLFDLSEDRGEMKNLAVESEYVDVLQEFRDILEEWMCDHHIRPTRPKTNDVPDKPLRL